MDDEQNGDIVGLCDGQSPEQQVLGELDRRRVRDAIGELPVKQRTVLYLFYYAELSSAGIEGSRRHGEKQIERGEIRLKKKTNRGSRKRLPC